MAFFAVGHTLPMPLPCSRNAFAAYSTMRSPRSPRTSVVSQRAVRKRLDGSLTRYMERMLTYLPGASDDERRAAFVVLFSGMSGAMALARACGDREMRERILGATRDYYLATFAGGREP